VLGKAMSLNPSTARRKRKRKKGAVSVKHAIRNQNRVNQNRR
jgi:hypothetical protein